MFTEISKKIRTHGDAQKIEHPLAFLRFIQLKKEMSAETKSYFDTFDFTPDAPGTYENREYGIDLAEITQELKDNSDDAKATRTDIYLLPRSDDDLLLDSFVCLDNGKGMVEETLYSAIKLSKHHTHDFEDAGQFGEGLKNATFALGDEIVIITKTKDSNPIGVFLNIPKMKTAKTVNLQWRPTSSGDPSKYKDIIDDDVYEKFCSYESGTLISVKKMKYQHLMKVNDAARSISHKFQLANSSTRGNDLHIHTSTVDLTDKPVELLDVFYRKNPQLLEDLIETTLKVCIFPDGHLEVYEYLQGVRYRGSRSGNKYIGSRDQATYWKFTGLLPDKTRGVSRRAYDKDCHQDATSLPINTEIHDISLRAVKVKEDVYKNEPINYPALRDVENRRRGIYYYRNNRLLRAATTPTDISLDDHSNRVRIEARFGPKLGKYMGVRTQKTMGNITNKAISNALHVFWKQNETKLCKKTDTDDATTVADEDDRSTVNSTNGKKTATPLPSSAPTKKTKKLKLSLAQSEVVKLIQEKTDEKSIELPQEEQTNQVLSLSSAEVSETEAHQKYTVPVFDVDRVESPKDMEITRFAEPHTPSPPSTPVPAPTPAPAPAPVPAPAPAPAPAQDFVLPSRKSISATTQLNGQSLRETAMNAEVVWNRLSKMNFKSMKDNFSDKVVPNAAARNQAVFEWLEMIEKANESFGSSNPIR